MSLRKISAEAFARRLRETSRDPDKRFAFFLGAGCSISSGIPAAGALVKDEWLPRLQRFESPDREHNEWVKERFPDYDGASPGSSYGAVMGELFLNAEERQREIERLCDGRFPGFGYASLASLMALDGGAFNVVLTTNFDDLIADALYLFTRARPLVIHHESLVGFIRSTRTRPLVVKLHGDNRLAPRNTVEETGMLKEEVQRQVASLLHDRGLIFMGYSGNDQGIADTMAALHDTALPLGVYWVSGEEPRGVIRQWLDRKHAVWVERADFDEFMLLLRDAFGLPHPEQRRFDEVFERYKSTYESLSKRIESLASTDPGASALKEAVRRTDRTFPSWYAVELEASRLAKDFPDVADDVYRRGLAQFPDSAPLLGNYANFLWTTRRDNEGAENFYNLALEVDPNEGINLNNYAFFLERVKNDFERAEDFYTNAIKANPSHPRILGNYAAFLQRAHKDFDRAEELFMLAISLDPNDASILGAYAVFLTKARNDFDHAEELFTRAIDADPNHANNLTNYAYFIRIARKDPERAEEFYQRALRVHPDHAPTLGNYAAFLHQTLADLERADDLYKRALEADPAHLNNLCNYAGFLLATGRLEEGLTYLQHAFERLRAEKNPGIEIELLLYRLLHVPQANLRETLRPLKQRLLENARSPGWDFSLNLARARESGIANIQHLESLAAVISGSADVSVLDAWDEWAAA